MVKNANQKYPQLHDPVQLQQLMDDCGSVHAVARKLGCSASAVCRQCKRMDISGMRRYGRLRDPDMLRGLQAKYLTDEGIAQHLGCTKQAVYAARKALGILPLTHRRHPALQTKAAFLALDPQNRSTADIAAELGCSTHLVWEACVRFGVSRPKGTSNPVLRHPDVLAHLMDIYNCDTHRVAEVIGAPYDKVRDSITRYRRRGII